MKIHRSINKRVTRIFINVQYRYLQGINNGKSVSFYFHPSFFHLYLKRIAWLFLALLTFKPSTYRLIYKIITNTYFPHNSHSVVFFNIKLLLRKLFGYSFLSIELYPAYSANFIYKEKTIFFKKPICPLVSIIIPVYNDLSYTYNCLLSINNNVSDSVNFEVLVIDDCSTDETEKFFTDKTKGLKYIRNEETIGEILSVNKAVSQAEGKYICLLDSHTEVQKDWLESLLQIIEKDDSVGCVGSKLLSPNNKLQEAGGIISKNGRHISFGKNHNPNQQKYNFIRQVDCCSGVSILMRRNDFERAGKFNRQYTLVNYHYIDLCFSFRNILHKKIMYHPLSKVLYYDRVSKNRKLKDSNSLIDQQEADRLKFFEEWEYFLRQHNDEADSKSYRRLLPSSTIVVIEWNLPTFNIDSGSLRLFRILNLLKSLDYHLVFIPENGNKLEPYYSALINNGIEIRLDLNSNNSLKDFKAVEYRNSVKYIWISKPELNNLYKDRIKAFENAKWIYDTVDLRHIKMLNAADLLKNNLFEIVVADKMKELEIQLAKEADLTVTITKEEKETLEIYGVKNVCIIPNIHIPVQISDFQPFYSRSGLVFIGGYQHVSNIDAAIWLISEIMPIVWKTSPDIPLYLLGSHPPDELLQMATPKIIIPGYTENIYSFFLTSKVFISPLRYRRGMKGKIGQALEYRLPIVSTTIGAEGMGFEDEKHLLIADDTQMFASQILRLYNDQYLWEKISNKSRSAILPYSPQVVREDLAHMFKKLEGQELPHFERAVR